MLEKQIQKAKEDLLYAQKLRKEGSINRDRENLHTTVLAALTSAEVKIRKAEIKYYGG